MVASKGYGPERGSGKGRGTFSVPKNPAPVPKKGSEMNLSSPLQMKDADKVKRMAREQMAREDLRGRSA
jgi:hypothetical protein